MLPTLTLHDRSDHILEIRTYRDAHGKRVSDKRRLPKPHTLGESAGGSGQGAVNTARRIPPKRTAGPGLARQAANYGKAAVQHARAGLPQATDEQVAKRFAACQQCELFEATISTEQRGVVAGKCLHPSCGCSLKAVGPEGRNKLRWADQACPLGKWVAIAVQ